MSTDDRLIECRSCGESFDANRGNCPSCGTGVRGHKGPIAMSAIGLLFLLLGIQSGGWLYGIVGLVVAVGGAYLLYDHRQRIKESPGTDDSR